MNLFALVLKDKTAFAQEINLFAELPDLKENVLSLKVHLNRKECNDDYYVPLYLKLPLEKYNFTEDFNWMKLNYLVT